MFGLGLMMTLSGSMTLSVSRLRSWLLWMMSSRQRPDREAR